MGISSVGSLPMQSEGSLIYFSSSFRNGELALNRESLTLGADIAACFYLCWTDIWRVPWHVYLYICLSVCPLRHSYSHVSCMSPGTSWVSPVSTKFSYHLSINVYFLFAASSFM